jgi:hypothetical protein
MLGVVLSKDDNMYSKKTNSSRNNIILLLDNAFLTFPDYDKSRLLKDSTERPNYLAKAGCGLLLDGPGFVWRTSSKQRAS